MWVERVLVVGEGGDVGMRFVSWAGCVGGLCEWRVVVLVVVVLLFVVVFVMVLHVVGRRVGGG